MKNEERGTQNVLALTAPFTGQAIALEDVPDPVFSQKIIGDGLAIIPEDGNLVSPVDGEVVSVAETLHAYGLRTDEGVELMIHVGLETVALKGECFQCCVKAGDRVKQGQTLAKVDLAGLKEKEVSMVTPVLVLGVTEDMKLTKQAGHVTAGVMRPRLTRPCA